MFPNLGVWLVAFVGFGMILGLTILDVRFIRTDGQPVGRWVQAWARRYPVLAFLLAAVLGLLIGHFYWSTPPICPVSHGQTIPVGTDRDCTNAQPGPTPTG